jgi:hypothetical protein
MSDIADVLSVKVLGRILRAAAIFEKRRGIKPTFISLPVAWWVWLYSCANSIPRVEQVKVCRTDLLIYHRMILYPSKEQNDIKVLI